MFDIVRQPTRITAGERVSIVLRYTHEGADLPVGGRLRLAYSDKDGAGVLQADDSSQPNHLALATTARAVLSVEDSIRRYRSITFFPGTGQSDLVVVSVAVREGRLKAGETVDFILGDPNDDGGRFLAGNFADSPLTFFFSLDDDNRFSPKALHPNALRYEQFITSDGESYPEWEPTGIQLKITPAVPVFVDLILPGSARAGERTMRIVVYDAHGNHLPRQQGLVRMIDQEGVRFEECEFDTGDDGHATVPIVFEREGIVAAPRFEIDGFGVVTANPVLIANDPTVNLFWGETHGHSNLSDGGSRGPDFFFDYARNIRRFDFAALADHAFGLAVNGHWRELREAVERHDRPGEFAAILGYEIMNPYDRDPGLGHRNLYFPDGEGRLVMADFQPGSGGTFVDEDIAAYRGIWDPAIPLAASIEDFFSEMAETEFLWTAHHCGTVDPCEKDVLELFEACSEWGRSDDVPERNRSTLTLGELSAQGVNVGLFGNSDDHAAKAGAKRTAHANGAIRHPSGITAVFSQRLSRGAIYAALKGKRCYATTGARMLIVPEVTRSNERLDIRLTLAGTDGLDEIAVFKNGEEVASLQVDGKFTTEFTWRDDVFADGDFCHVRIRQRDGEMAWINPVPFVGSELNT